MLQVLPPNTTWESHYSHYTLFPVITGHYVLIFPSSVHSQSCAIFGDPMDCRMPGLPVHHQLLGLLKLMSIQSVMPSNLLILCHPLLLPSIFPSTRVFQISQLFSSSGQNIGASASASVLPIFSFRVDWLDLLAIQGTLKSLLWF